MDDSNRNSILVPATTAWPFFAALGITLMFAGIVTHAAVSIVGGILLLRAVVGWWRDVLPQEKHEVVPVSVAAEAPRSSSAVDHLVTGAGDHRVRIPVEVHPYWTGIYGGLAGAVAMAAVAMLFGLIAQRSIWYPINLLAATVLPSLAEAPVEQLRHFSASSLIAGSIIHSLISLLVGLLYAVTLPMFPRGAELRSGLVTPVLWSGLVAATLSVINPVLNARIDWSW